MQSTSIVDKLLELEHRPWAELGRSKKPLTTTKLANMLGDFKIAPKRDRKKRFYKRARSGRGVEAVSTHVPTRHPVRKPATARLSPIPNPSSPIEPMTGWHPPKTQQRRGFLTG